MALYKWLDAVEMWNRAGQLNHTELNHILNSCHKPYRKQNVTVIGFGRLYRKADGTRRQMKRRVRVEHSISV